MDKQVYDLVKSAIANGKSLDEITKEFNDIVQQANEDLKPKTAIKDVYAGRYVALADLINYLGAYLVRNGFEPDRYFKDNEDFRKWLKQQIDGIAHQAMFAARLVDLKDAGASPAEILKTFFSDLFTSDETKEFDF